MLSGRASDSTALSSAPSCGIDETARGSSASSAAAEEEEASVHTPWAARRGTLPFTLPFTLPWRATSPPARCEWDVALRAPPPKDGNWTVPSKTAREHRRTLQDVRLFHTSPKLASRTCSAAGTAPDTALAVRRVAVEGGGRGGLPVGARAASPSTSKFGTKFGTASMPAVERAIVSPPTPALASSVHSSKPRCGGRPHGAAAEEEV